MWLHKEKDNFNFDLLKVVHIKFIFETWNDNLCGLYNYFIVLFKNLYIYILFQQVKSVRLPRHATSKNAASGYAVVEFVSEEEAQKILKLELICQGATLALEPK